MKLKLVLFLLVPVLVYSQYGLNSSISNHTIGVNKITGDSIMAQDLTFSYSQRGYFIDSSNGILIIFFPVLDSYGESTSNEILASYSLKENKILWVQNIEKEKLRFTKLGDKFYQSSNKSTGLWNPKTNELIWQINSPLYLSRELQTKNIGLALALKSDGKNLAGVSLDKGEILWKNNDLKIPRYAIIFPQVIDNQFIFLNEILMGINLTTGKSWERNRFFNHFESKGGNTAAFFGGLVGYLIYTAVSSSGINGKPINPSYVEQHHSNFFVEDSCFYIGSREFLHKYHQNGTLLFERWHANERNAGISKIVNINRSKYFINYGYSMLDGSRAYALSSKFFIEKFDDSLNFIDSFDYKISKKAVGISSLEGHLLDVDVYKNQLRLVGENGFLVLDSNFRVVSITVLKTEKFWKERKVEDFFYYKDSIFYEVKKSDQDIYMTLANNTVERYSAEGRFKELYHPSIVYSIIYEDEYIKCISQEGKFKILNLRNQLIYEGNDILKFEKFDSQYLLSFISGFLIIDTRQLVK